MDSKQGTSQKIAVLGGRSELNPNARKGNKKNQKSYQIWAWLRYNMWFSYDILNILFK